MRQKDIVSQHIGSMLCRSDISVTDMLGIQSQFLRYSKWVAKVRGIELSLLQRCAAHLASETDIEESYLAGKTAVEAAISGVTDKMVAFERAYEDGAYTCKTKLLGLTEVANTEKKVPLEWINKDGNGMTQAYIDYVLPLIQGEPNRPMADSLPRFARLKKVLVKE